MKTEELQRLRALLAQHYDEHPVAMLATDERGRVLWKNLLARSILPGIKQRSILSRRLTGDLPRAGESSCVEISSEHYFVFSEPQTPVPLFFLQPLHGGFRSEFASFLIEYERTLTALSSRALKLLKEREGTAREVYLKELGEHLSTMEDTQKLFDVLKTVRVLHEGRVVPVSAGEFLSFFSKTLFAVRPSASSRLCITAESGVVALLNFRDFLCALLHLYSFFESFVLSKRLELSLRRCGDGECVFEFSGEDRHNVLSLYRIFCRRRESDAQILRQSALFFPLFCAMERLLAHRHRVSVFHRDGKLYLTVTVRTTLEFPTLVVRRDEQAEVAKWTELAAEALLPERITELLCANLAAADEPLPLNLSCVQKPRLFD